MSMKTCPVCGSNYPDTHDACPFCKEDHREQETSWKVRSQTRAARLNKQFRLIAGTQALLIFVMAGSLGYLLSGAGYISGDPSQPAYDTSETVTDPQSPPAEKPPVSEDREPSLPADEPHSDVLPEESPGTSPAPSEVPEEVPVVPPAENDAVSSVPPEEDPAPPVTPSEENTDTPAPSEEEPDETPVISPEDTVPSGVPGTADELQPGPARVVNAENGVRVRSGPGTTYDPVASVYNGGYMEVLEPAGDGWYKVWFLTARSEEVTGYMMGRFLKNK